MMKMRRVNRRLAETVIATLRTDSPDRHAERLHSFAIADWRRSYYWLDASGLALYFFRAVKSKKWLEAVPAEVVRRLEQNLMDNEARTAELFDEFISINEAFQSAGVRYLNLKGFTLVPDYCPDPSLRCLFDLDFLVSARDVPRSGSVLRKLGYILTGSGERVAEFKKGSEEVPKVRDLYKPKPQRSVELHFAFSDHESAEGPIQRSQQRIWNGFAFPSLPDSDMFLAQAVHLFGHVQSEWTRAAWLLEYRTCINTRLDEEFFWRQVSLRALNSEDGPTAIGAATLLAVRAFGVLAPPALAKWTVDTLSRPVRLWIERYGKEILLADFPGTKLYLLLQGELGERTAERKDRDKDKDKEAGAKFRRSKLFPMRPPPQVVHSAAHGIGFRAKAWMSHFRYTLLRLSFHVVASWRYCVEAPKWKRVLAEAPN